MKCIIVDDEPLAREGMRMNIEELDNLELVGEFASAAEASKFLLKNKVDLMFLDVEMPGTNGIDFLKNLDNPPMVILTTAYPQYAVEAYELDVVDYLVKPIKFERFVRSVAKADEIMKMSASPCIFDAYEDKFIFIKSERKYVKVNFDDLLFIEGLKDYVIIHATHGKYMTAMNVKTIFNKLPENTFFRVSKSYIVNVNHIDDIDGAYINIKGNQVPIGRSYRDSFVDYINTRLLRR
ncbi:MAG: response regulator transcription factor [Bacteroidales bacterium]|nr:response regulator transcription factor [Bacteroidales bacterium]MBR4584548.1 response regulator transcription factor [Bacteroidales bacterium]